MSKLNSSSGLESQNKSSSTSFLQQRNSYTSVDQRNETTDSEIVPEFHAFGPLAQTPFISEKGLHISAILVNTIKHDKYINHAEVDTLHELGLQGQVVSDGWSMTNESSVNSFGGSVVMKLERGIVNRLAHEVERLIIDLLAKLLLGLYEEK